MSFFVNFVAIVIGVLAVAVALVVAYYNWPAIIKTKPRTPGAIWARSMMHPSTKPDWHCARHPDRDEYSCSNDKLGARWSWHWYDGFRAPFPLSWADERRLDYAANRILAEDRKRRHDEALVNAAERLGRAYLGRTE